MSSCKLIRADVASGVSGRPTLANAYEQTDYPATKFMLSKRLQSCRSVFRIAIAGKWNAHFIVNWPEIRNAGWLLDLETMGGVFLYPMHIQNEKQHYALYVCAYALALKRSQLALPLYTMVHCRFVDAFASLVSVNKGNLSSNYSRLSWILTASPADQTRLLANPCSAARTAPLSERVGSVSDQAWPPPILWPDLASWLLAGSARLTVSSGY